MFRHISYTNNMRLIMVFRMIINVILHLFIICYDLRSTSFFQKNFVITEALFSEAASDVSWLPGCKQTSRDGYDFETTSAFHVDWIVFTTQQVTRDGVPMLANPFNWHVRWQRPARVPLFSLGLKVPWSPCGHSGRLLADYRPREVRNFIYR